MLSRLVSERGAPAFLRSDNGSGARFQGSAVLDCRAGLTASATMASSISCGTRFFSTGFLRLISCNASSPPLSWSSLNR